MKKVNKINLFKILMFIILFGLSNTLFAQIDFYVIGQSSLTPGSTTTVQVRISSPTTLSLGYDININYDKNVLTYVSRTPFYPTTGPLDWYVSTSLNPNGIVLGYSNISGGVMNTYPSNTLVCELTFTFNGGTTTLTADDNAGGFYDVMYAYLSATFHSGTTSGSFATITSVAGGGNWSAPASWNLGHIPNTSNGNVVINSASATPLMMDATYAVNGDLTINAGKALTLNSGKTLTLSGNFTIYSDATGTGSFINNGTYTGNANVQRYIANDNGWHFLSSPVNAQTIKPAFAPTTADNTFDFYKWDETIVNSATTFPWINIRNTNGTYATGFDNFVNGQGYLVAYSSSYGGSATHQFFGTLNNAAQTASVNYGVNNYNLLGNPFPSAIDWNATGFTGRDALLGTNAPIWVWNGSTGTYGAYSNGVGGTNGVTNVIAPHQGFFVHSVAAGSFTIPTAAKVHPGSQNFLKSTTTDLLRLKVSTSANTYSDEMIVNFDNNATTNDGVAKWFSLLSDAPSLYSVKNGNNLSINTLQAITNNLVVPVSFKAGVNGTYVISASELNSFASGTYIYLNDLKRNILLDLSKHSSYVFNATTSDNTERFQLIFSLTPLSVPENQVTNNTSIYTYDNILYVNSTEKVKQVSIYNTIGQLIYSSDNTAGSFKYNLNGNKIGYYIVKVITEKNVSSEKVFVK
jgi:hypothetical protein